MTRITLVSKLATINSGNYGSVYLGKHIVFHKDPVVAIKLLHTHLNVSREQKRFFQYELLTGRRPFVIPFSSLEAMWHQHTNVQPTVPGHLNPALPAHVEKAILTALARNRADRHADVSIFIKALYTSPIADSTRQAKIYQDLGCKLNDLKRYTDALSAFDQAIRLEANNGFVHGQRAFALEMLGRFSEALEAYGEALRLGYTGDGWAYSAKGCILERLSRNEEALEAYEEALRLGYTDGGWTAKRKALVLKKLL